MVTEEELQALGDEALRARAVRLAGELFGPAAADRVRSSTRQWCARFIRDNEP